MSTQAVRPALSTLVTQAAGTRLKALQYPLLGIALLLGLWWLGGQIIASNPETEAFAGFAPVPSFLALADMVQEASLWESVGASLYRVLVGLLWGIGLGVPLGVLVGWFASIRQLTSVPFQFLRMISPLAWMPVAVLGFATWDSAIIFLIVMAALWPILYSTAHGVKRIDPNWLTLARNLGAGPVDLLRRVIVPAIMMDVLAGVRLAVGVAWVVLVPAEYLGVSSGLGYAINDARDTLEYDRLAAIVLVIGVIGYGLDMICARLIRRFNWRAE